MNKKKRVLIFVFAILFLISISLSFSYSWFKKVLETDTSVDIVVGTLDFTLRGDNLENNQMTIHENDDILISLDIQNNQSLDSKYGIYYRFITELSAEEKNNVQIFNYEGSSKLAEDSIKKNGTNTVELVIVNPLHKNVTIEFGVASGLIHNDLEVTQGMRIAKSIGDTDKLKIKKIVSYSEKYYQKSGMTSSTTLTLPNDNDKILLPDNEIVGTVYIKSDGRVAFQGLNHNLCMFQRFGYENAEIVENHHDVCNQPLYRNLIENGYGEYGSNVHFPNAIYVDDTNDFKIDLAFEISQMPLFIPVDSTKKYRYQIDMYTDDPTGKNYVGFIEYDVDRYMISAPYIMYVNNTLTSLARDLNDGDTIVYFNDLSNWQLLNPAYARGFIFWNYKDSTGYTYLPETYSRNVFSGLYENANLDKNQHAISLSSPWNEGQIKSGTKVSQSYDGAGNNFSLRYGQTLTDTYTTYSSTIAGVSYNNASFNSFRSGVKYIRPMFMFNYRDSTHQGEFAHLKKLIFEEIEN